MSNHNDCGDPELIIHTQLLIERMNMPRQPSQLEQLVHYRLSSPDDIRKAGWRVLLHQDFKDDGVTGVLWVFKNDSDDSVIQQEASTDREALEHIRKMIGLR